MPRYYKPVSESEFHNKVLMFFDELSYDYDFRDIFRTDLKIKFDFENFERSSGSFGPKDLMGLQKRGDFYFLGCCAGGDWEVPVYFIIYVDNKGKLRAYVPTDGNPWNSITKQAYGNDDEQDRKDLIKKKIVGAKEIDPDWDSVLDFVPDFNSKRIEEDIKIRIIREYGA